MTVTFQCPRCAQRLSVDASRAGTTAKCPKCATVFTVPEPASATPAPSAPAESFCPKCGQKNLASSLTCTGCGFALHASAQPQYTTGDDGTLGGLIPFRNAKALWAYYLGVFSLIPCFGFPLAIAALILGLGGLKYAKAHPESKGQAHAWVGIIVGSLCVIAYCILAAIGVVAALYSKKH